MNYCELLLQEKNRLDEMIVRIESRAVGNGKVQAELDALKSMLDQLSASYEQVLDSYDGLSFDFHGLLDIIYGNALEKSERLMLLTENRRIDLVDEINGMLHSQQDMVKKLVDGFEAKEQFRTSWESGNETETVVRQIEAIGEGVRPTFEDCLKCRVGETPAEEVFRRLLWLDRMEYTAKLAGIEETAEQQSLYRSTRSRIISEINGADPASQMEYVKLIARHYNGMKKSGNSFYSGWANHFITSFGDSKTEELLYVCGTEMPEAEPVQPAAEEDARAYAITLSDCGYTASGTVGKVSRIYGRIMTDTNPASPTFAAMKYAMGQLGSFDFEEKKTDVTAQKRVIERALDSARIYKKNHKSFALSESGQRRLEDANSLISELAPLHNDLVEMENTLIRERRDNTNGVWSEIVLERNRNRVDPDMMIRYAYANRLLGTSQIKPRQPEFYAKEGWFSRLFSSVKHVLYTGILAIATATIGIAEYILTSPWQIKGTGAGDITAETDRTAVPGSKTGEHFDAEPDYDSLPDDQDIIKDNRRFPVVYEKPIPEDPDQPPTLTIEVDQALEGDTNGFPISKDINGQRFQMGHAFIALCYTKTNPLTGRPERYKCCFGFYPSAQVHEKVTMYSQGLDGLRIPGTIDNDFNHDYSVGKTYTVTNKQINKVFSAASKFDTGGYNYMKRNCATFAKEMAEAAGLDVSGFFESRELNCLAVAAISPAGILAGKATSRLGMKTMLSHADETSENYHNYGQKLITRDTVTDLDKRKFNISLRGYIPGSIAESMRQDPGFSLHSKKYHTDVSNVLDVRDETLISTVRMTQISVEQAALTNSITQYARRHHLDLNEALDKMNRYMDTFGAAIDYFADRAMNGQDSRGRELRFWEQRQSIIECTKAVNDFIKGINDIYKDTFKSDPELNLCFQHYISNLETLKNNLHNKYNTLYDEIIAEHGKLPGMSSRDLDGLTDSRKDAAFARRLFSVGSMDYTRGRSTDTWTVRNYIGILKTFGSMREYFEQKAEIKRIRDARATRTLTDDEQAASEKMDRLLELANSFAKTEDNLLIKDRFTEHDLRFIFSRMRNSDDEVKCNSPEFSAYNVVAALAFDKCIGGIKENLTAKMSAWQNAYVGELRKLAETYRDFDSPDFVLPKMKLDEEYGAKMVNIVADYVIPKLRTSEEYKMIVGILAEENAKEYDRDYNTASDEDKVFYRSRAELELMSGMMDSYLRPVMREVNWDAMKDKHYSKMIRDFCIGITDEELSSHSLIRKVQMKPFRDFAIENRQGIVDKEDVIATVHKANFDSRCHDLTESSKIRKVRGNSAIAAKCRSQLYDLLAKECEKGEVSNDDPNVQTVLSQLIVTHAILNSLNHDVLPMNGNIDAEFISNQAEILVKEGKFKEIINKINDPNLAHVLVADFKKDEQSYITESEQKLLKDFVAHSEKLAEAVKKIEAKNGPEFFKN